MGRRRGQRQGYLRAESGSWLLTYRVYDQFGRAKRETVTIGPAAGRGKLTEKQAERFAWDHYLSKVDQISRAPKSTMTVGQFWSERFDPGMALRLKPSTINQYRSLWRAWIEPRLGSMGLHQVTPDHIEALIGEVLAAGKSRPTAGHVRKVVSAVFTHAKRRQVLFGENPAGLVEIRGTKQRSAKVRALTVEQSRVLLESIPDPYRTMAMVCLLTSANIAEVCGLRSKHCNLSDAPVEVDGELIPARHISIREHYSCGQYGSLKETARRRDIPLPPTLCLALAGFVGAPDAPLFRGRTGRPINANNTQKRWLSPLAETIGVPSLGWHTLRHTHATMTQQQGTAATERQRLMGHASPDMTARYTHAEADRLRAAVEDLEQFLQLGCNPIRGMVQ